MLFGFARVCGYLRPFGVYLRPFCTLIFCRAILKCAHVKVLVMKSARPFPFKAPEALSGAPNAHCSFIFSSLAALEVQKARHI